MAEDKSKAGQPQPKPAAAPSKKADRAAVQSEVLNDPALAKYHALLIQNEDKQTLEKSLLISLLSFIVLTFVVFPEIAAQIIDSGKQDDIIEIPKQTIIKQEQKQEQKQEVQRTQQQRRNEFSSVPDISRPTADDTIIEDIPIDRLQVQTADVDDMFFGGAPDDSPGPIEVAGDVVKPEVQFTGAQPFPQKAKILRRAGKVKVRLIIRKNGSYEVVKVLEENPPDFGFGDACLEYLKSSRWQPATQNGRPIDVYFELTIMFNLKS
jgi:TonB family protein